MRKVSIYLYTDDGATVNCEIKSPSVDQLIALQALLDDSNNPAGSAVIGADTTATGASRAIYRYNHSSVLT
jgi:hypothetical protein